MTLKTLKGALEIVSKIHDHHDDHIVIDSDASSSRKWLIYESLFPA